MVFTARRFLYISFLIIFLVSVFFSLMLKKFENEPLTITKEEILYVPPGSSVYTVANELHARGLLKHPLLFIFNAHRRGLAKKIKAGEYIILPAMTSEELLIKIIHGKVLLHPFTIVEGWTLKQVLTALHHNPQVIHAIDTMVSIDLSKKLGITSANLEGQLFPDTYLFAAGIPDYVLLKKAISAMQTTLTRLWLQRASNLPFNSPYEALIVASLIEKETAKPEERAIISGVIARRLIKNMRLQIDASVIYGLGDAYRGKLTHNDLKIDTPYNTYLHVGLPPSPIAMPSYLSLYAALHPKEGHELYYVTRGDGTHEFSDTFKQHHLAILRYHPLAIALKPIAISALNMAILPVAYITWFSPLKIDTVNLYSGYIRTVWLGGVDEIYSE